MHPGLESCKGHREMFLKRRRRYRWVGLLTFEKPKHQDADLFLVGGSQHDNHVNREWTVGPA